MVTWPDTHKRVLSMLAIVALCRCSGGGGSSPVALRTAAPIATGAPATPSSPSSPDASARFTITVPSATATNARARTPKYVSTATASVIITLVSVSGAAYTGTPASIAANLTTANPACSGSPLTCTVSAPASGGSDVFKVVTYDAAQTSTNPSTPAGNVLSLATTAVEVTSGAANAVTTPLVLSGVATSVDVGLSPATVTEGTPVASITVAVNVRDADDKIIMGSYVDTNGNALTIGLSDSDASGATKLSTTSVTTSATSVSLSYDGTNIASPTITPTVSGGTISGASANQTLTVSKPSAPTLTLLSQNDWVSGASATSFTETLTGTNFTTVGTSIAVSISGLSVSNVTIESATSISATFSVAANASGSTGNISVNTPGGTTANLSLAIKPGVIVTSSADTAPGSPPGTGAGVSGDLRYTLQNASPGATIVFQCGTPPAVGCAITLAGPLPPIEKPLTIDGGGAANTSINGAGAYRAFFLDYEGQVKIEDMTIENVTAQGGAGNYGGGGGLGAGAGVFVNAQGPTTVANVVFANVSAIGGVGSDSSSNFNQFGGGGGGGLDAPGGANAGGTGSGGGGVLSQGGSTNDEDAFGGGGGGAGLGGAEGGESNGGAAGSSYGIGNAAAQSGGNSSGGADGQLNGGNGGAGGFGGGGGGGGEGSRGNQGNDGVGGNGGAGGFGGGGGAGAICTFCSAGTGGAGGPGGGGGGGGLGFITAPLAGNGGALATLTGGNGSTVNGGGGAAAGPAIFNFGGDLTTSNDTVTTFTITAGAGSADTNNGYTAASSGTAGSAPVFNYAGRVNGSSTTGDVSTAVSPASMARKR